MHSILIMLSLFAFSTPKYKKGECYYLVDPENNYQGDKNNALKIAGHTKIEYTYYWWVPDFKGGYRWASSTDNMKQETLEKITKRLIPCPGS